MIAPLMMRTPADGRGCALYHDDDAAALHQLARWWCPGLHIEGGEP